MKKHFIAFFFVCMLLAPFQMKGENGTFHNPIIPGFNPDPSVCRVGNDYYLVTSSFEWFPGLPIYQSKDLVNWKQIGHVLNRPSQLQMKEGMPHSEGLWAPTIRYHKGLFYVICTAVGAGGTFFVTAEKPEGPYSEPKFIENATGIDPSLFFDDDGRCWYSGSINGNNKIPPRRYRAEDRIYVQELDLTTGRYKGERKIVTSGYAINSPYAEAPHIYKIKGKYYLLISEGGTWENHAITAFMSDSVQGPYIPFILNPVLTHRHLGNDIDITTIGHTDIVQTQFGDWYAVMLGVRPIQGFNMLGRETFLTPVQFQGDVPVFNPGIGRVLSTDKCPKLPWTPVESPYGRDNFDAPTLAPCWSFLRTPFTKWYELKNGMLKMELRPQRIQDLANPSLIARRVQHHRFSASCKMIFEPKTPQQEAGLIIMQDNKFNYRIIVKLAKNKRVVQLLKTEAGIETLMSENAIAGNIFYLKVTGDMLKYSFFDGKDEANMIALGDAQDATVCSANKADSFIGPFVGMYATSNGDQKSKKNFVSFDWFDYTPQ